GNQRRVRVWIDDLAPKFMRRIRAPIDTRPDDDESESDGSTSRRFWYWYESPKSGDSDGSKSNKLPVLWQVHTDDVVNNATNFVERLRLPDDLKRAVVCAAKWHDLGKK